MILRRFGILSVIHVSKSIYHLQFGSARCFYSKTKGLVLGVYTESSDNANKVVSYTPCFKAVDKKYDGKLQDIVTKTGPFYKPAKQKLIWLSALNAKNADDAFDCLSVVDLGAKDAVNSITECIDQKSENVRVAIAGGIRSLQAASNFSEIYLDPCDYPQCVGESAILTIHEYNELKKKTKPKSQLHLYKYENLPSSAVSDFEKGVNLAQGQNFARFLMEAPANYMTPTIFATTVQEKFKDSKVEVIIRDLKWIESMKMGSFLSVTHGSEEPPKFVELHYNGLPSSKEFIAMVGKGITFDSGGISIKPSPNMDKMRGDMGGAACIAGALKAASALDLKINIKAFIPLTENLPSGKATKPGDVAIAMNGKSIQIDNTDAEGRLVLADGLCYAQQFKPKAVIDLATLTGAMLIALGEGAAGVFSNDNDLWKILEEAGFITGDRVWRMPLFRLYTDQVKECQLADVRNITSNSYGGSCTAAAFLQEFINPGTKWMHMDIAGVMDNDSSKLPYLCKGMSGRPTRTLVQFLQSLADKKYCS